MRPIHSLILIVAMAAAAQAQTIERDGVSVGFAAPQPAIEQKDVQIRFTLRAADGTPLTGVRPAAWIDARDPHAGEHACRDKIQSFLGGTLRVRPQVDLNTYYVLTLNADPSIAVIDPLLGFGGSKLLTSVTLPSPGVDWALSRDQRRLYVAMPLVNRVAVIDTETWSVVRSVETAYRPARVALDGEHLWVAAQNAITVVDTRTFGAAKTIAIGNGPHQIAFDGKQAFVSNGADGTISIVDARSPASATTLRTGSAATGLAYSTLGHALYVIDGVDGTIAVVDPARRAVTSRIAAKPGLGSIDFAPGGRYAFVTNGAADVVHIVDASTAKIIATAADIGRQPDQIAFTEDYAYVRAAGSDAVKMIALAGLREGVQPSVSEFPAGQLPPSAAHADSTAAAIIAAPDPKSVLVANPADRLVYYYTEGMAAPMGNLVAPGRAPKAVLVVDQSLEESDPGVYTIRTRVPAAGLYDVAFFLDSPRVAHCFDLRVQPDPAAPPKPPERRVKIEPRLRSVPVRAGGEVEVEFRLSDASTSEPRRGVRDLQALAFLAPGTWQKRLAMQPGDDGVYRVRVPVPEAGIYYVFLESPSLSLALNKTRPLIFEAVKP